MGDLNYRIDLPRQQVIDIIESKDIIHNVEVSEEKRLQMEAVARSYRQQLITNDQLVREMAEVERSLFVCCLRPGTDGRLCDW